jgi:two-component system chemotaxis response regulator CheB
MKKQLSSAHNTLAQSQIRGASETTGRDIVAIGASAGGIRVLLQIASALPPDFGAAILVVVHIGNRPSLLPRLLERAGPLPAAHARDGEPIMPGRIYVAPPDVHMVVEDGHLRLSRGPRENRFRPAIDPMFRSVGVAYGARAIAIVLSGALSDGTVGLATVKAHGGLTVVQDPAEALVSGMPDSAVAAGNIDLVLTSEEMVAMLSALPRHPVSEMESSNNGGSYEKQLRQERIVQDLRDQSNDIQHKGSTLFTCPDCGGTLWQVDEQSVLRFQCHVGHGWSWEALLDQKSEQLESALWATSRLFVERSVLRRQIASRIDRVAPNGVFEQKLALLAEQDENRATELQDMLKELTPYFGPERELD